MSNNNNNTNTTNNIINPNQCVYRCNTRIHWKYLRTPILKFLLKRNLFVQIDINKNKKQVTQQPSTNTVAKPTYYK